MAIVAISQNDRIARAIDEALEHLALDDLLRGRTVAVKPNDTWASPDDTTGVTQPDTLRAVLRFLKRYAPRHIVVTGGAGAADTSDVFRISGMMAVIDEEEVEFFDHNRGPFVPVTLKYAPNRDVAGPQKQIMVNPRVTEYEVLVSLAQLKLHETATVTLCLKNIAMSFPAADYYGHPRATQHHQNCFFDDMHSFIAAMAWRFPIDLGIVVGHPAMIATGPLGGKAVETGLVIAGRDAVAVDTVGARLLGFTAQGVRYLWEVAKINLGETNLDRMAFPGLSLEDGIKAFTRRAYGTELTFQHA